MADPLASVQELQDRIDALGEWPPKDEKDLHEALNIFSALYSTDGAALRDYAGIPHGHAYVPDPLPQKMADASSNLIFGEEPDFEAGDPIEDDEHEPPDQPLLDDLIDANDLPSELQRAAALCAAEGEVWWHIRVDKVALNLPILDWNSRRSVVPLWRSRQLLACAFVSVMDDSTDNETWRYVEIHAPGVVRRLLYLGRVDRLGDRQDLGAHPDTAPLEEDWRHGLVMLAGRVANRLGHDTRIGLSDYAGVLEYLFALNEAASIGKHNARLTLRKRAVMPVGMARASDGVVAGDQADRRGRGATVDLDDVWLVEPGDELEGSNGPMRILEYSDSWAQALTLYKADLTETILTRVGVAPQLVGLHTENAVTGPAARFRLLDSIQTANGKARYWDDQLPKALMAAAMVDNLEDARGGFGRQWVNPMEPPTVRRRSILPQDPTETATRVVALRGAGIISEATALEEVFPEWSDERRQQEADEVAGESQARSASLSAGVRVERPAIVLNGSNGPGAAPTP
jgi:hypothetical protein